MKSEKLWITIGKNWVSFGGVCKKRNLSEQFDKLKEVMANED